MDMTLNDFKLLTPTCWKEKDQLLTIDMTKDKDIGKNRFVSNSIFFPYSSPF